METPRLESSGLVGHIRDQVFGTSHEAEKENQENSEKSGNDEGRKEELGCDYKGAEEQLSAGLQVPHTGQVTSPGGRDITHISARYVEAKRTPQLYKACTGVSQIGLTRRRSWQIFM